jgi:hypothetical protein
MTSYDPLVGPAIVIVGLVFAIGVPLDFILGRNKFDYYTIIALSFSGGATTAILLFLYWLMQPRTIAGGYGTPELFIPGIPIPQALLILSLGLFLAGLVPISNRSTKA